MSYYTPHDLAREMGQSPRNARRVFAEQGYQHDQHQWWRLDLSNPHDRLFLEQLRRTLNLEPPPTPPQAQLPLQHRYGCRRRRRKE